MPIDLSQLNTKAIDDVTPKYFHKKLTGSGKKVGFLNEMKNPWNLSGNNLVQTLSTSRLVNTKRESYQNGNAHYTGIPFYIIPPNVIANDLTHLMVDDQATPITNNQDTVVAYSLEPHSLIIQEIKENNKIVASDYSLIFRYYYWIINEPNLPTAKLVDWCEIQDYYKGGLTQCCKDHPDTNFVVTGLTDNPKYEFANPKVVNPIKGLNPGDPAIDDKIKDYVKNLSTYDLVKEVSRVWQNDIHKVLDPVFARYGQIQTYSPKQLERLLNLVQHLESYPIPLDLYQHIYASIHTCFTPSTRRMICALNLNLLLSDTLEQLNQSKGQLNCLPNTTVPVDPFYSQEQAMAIATKDPLVLVQAGAGTGKSSTILARIDYMVKSGIDPKDITVLSFTNAAANHILEKNPKVHSMTIASMVHQIYAANYPNHQLSTLNTLANTLDIYYKNDEFAKAFREQIYRIILNKPNAFVLMNLFVEEHFDRVIEYLSAIGQTALELEIIICYQKIGDFVEPPGVACKYLIIDEVQDNSIFEFVYTLKYVNKHKQNLFIVGRL